MWPDASQRSAEIRKRADIFKEQRFPATSELLHRLAGAVDRGTASNRVAAVQKILSTFRQEWGKGDSAFLALYDFVENTILESLISLEQGFGAKLLQMQPQITEMRKAATVIEDMAKIFLRVCNLSKKDRFYAACIEHVMDVEGQFDEACRILYVLYKASAGQSSSLSDIENLQLKDLRKEIRDASNSKSEILFQGWEKGHLRNAIAHARIEYDDATDRMHFVDKRRDGVETYNERLSLEQFSRHFWLTKGVSFVFLRIMMILRASDFAFAYHPFQTVDDLSSPH